MKKTRLDLMKEQMIKKLEEERGKAVTARMEEEYKSLCATDEKRPPQLTKHLHKNIYPVAAAFRALMQSGMPREEAAAFARESFLELMDKPAAAIQRLCRIPGMYRLVPKLFCKLMPKLFSREAGFEFRFCSQEKNRARFDMLHCPYLDVCRELDCPELAPAFCKTDEICYSHMHPKLVFRRTETLAAGGSRCDFDVVLTEEKSSR